ncbi:TIGR02452 family protein [Paenibacillus elgii]|uniref:TIGR02452 family protein n=1 Tax=Paenibacillus elgii TaxID=189691 RepID=UPI000FD65AB6|nr:TIGR02452 family protein [Paenibacillus elgii]NEN84030.1 TIGR02452 family protein [Paenibacillus elgii]
MNASTHNREIRSKIAKETLDILEQGFYTSPSGTQITIRDEVETAVAKSVLYAPDQLPNMLKEASTVNDRIGITPHIEVTNESTLAAAQRLVALERVTETVCLNFASAKNPGGGFLGGSQAQEESLARSSALYPCISQMSEMYDHNRGLKTCFYSDYMIYSPKVPVFREDRGSLLPEPYLVSMITAPAVNAGVVREREPENTAKIDTVMLERIRFILAVAAAHGQRAMILGAYGCGVFRNNPKDIARLFKQALIDEGRAAWFDHIVFAILDNSADKRTLNEFKMALEP